MISNCSICLEEICDTTVTPCRHVFCYGCITNWVNTNENCPLCREPVYYEDIKDFAPRQTRSKTYDRRKRKIALNLTWLINQANAQNMYPSPDYAYKRSVAFYKVFKCIDSNRFLLDDPHLKKVVLNKLYEAKTLGMPEADIFIYKFKNR
jgi:hypothetical protein